MKAEIKMSKAEGRESRTWARASAPSARSGAFSFIEIMVVMGLLAVMVLGLMAMFNQTQRAFRLGMSQTDILESGRLVTDLIARELEQMTPCYYSNYNSTWEGKADPYEVPNFAVGLDSASWQALPGGFNLRTNVLQSVFFLIRQNQTWTGIGYFVRTNNANIPSLPGGIGPVGTLFRVETKLTFGEFEWNPGGMWAGLKDVLAQVRTNDVSKIVDGVVHFRVRSFDTGGWILTNNPAWWVNPAWTRPFTNNSLPVMLLSSNLMPRLSSAPEAPESGETMDVFCYSNVVPAVIEFELGILEPDTYQQYRSIPIEQVRWDFLTNQQARAVSHMHLFRRRVSIHNVDRTAYNPFPN